MHLYLAVFPTMKLWNIGKRLGYNLLFLFRNAPVSLFCENIHHYLKFNLDPCFFGIIYQFMIIINHKLIIFYTKIVKVCKFNIALLCLVPVWKDLGFSHYRHSEIPSWLFEVTGSLFFVDNSDVLIAQCTILNLNI